MLSWIRNLLTAKWYVLYPDGYTTRDLSWQEARDLRRIFGGTIHRRKRGPS